MRQPFAKRATLRRGVSLLPQRGVASTAAARAEEEKLAHIFLAKHGGDRSLPRVLWLIGLLTGLVAGLTGTAGNLVLLPLLMAANDNFYLDMTTLEMVGHATVVSMAVSLFFSVGSVLQRKNHFDVGLLVALLVPFCAGVPSGVAWHRHFHTETLTKVTAYALAVVGLGLAVWSFAVGTDEDGDA